MCVFSKVLFAIVTMFVLCNIFCLVCKVRLPLSDVKLVDAGCVAVSVFLTFTSVCPSVRILLCFVLPVGVG